MISLQIEPSTSLCACLLSDVQMCGEWRQVAEGSSAGTTVLLQHIRHVLMCYLQLQLCLR